MSWFRPRTKAERAEGKPYALFDRELFDRVAEIVDGEVGDLAEQGRLMIERELDEDSESGDVILKPAAHGVTGIWLNIWDDTVGFGTGDAGACHELWTTVDASWEDALRQRIRCVRDGRYSEVVRRGFMFPLKVTMLFGGIPGRKGKDLETRYGSTLASEDGRLPMPPTGTSPSSLGEGLWSIGGRMRPLNTKNPRT